MIFEVENPEFNFGDTFYYLKRCKDNHYIDDWYADYKIVKKQVHSITINEFNEITHYNDIPKEICYKNKKDLIKENKNLYIIDNEE